MKQKIYEEEMEDELLCRCKITLHEPEDEMAFISSHVIAAAELLSRKERKAKSPDIIRDQSFWDYGYGNWNNETFKRKLRVSRETFEYILQYIYPHLHKKKT